MADRRTLVLIVDHEPTTRQTLRAILEPDHDVIEAATGAETTAIVATRAVDLVLLEILLPDVDGLEVLQRLRALRPEMPVLVVSAVRLLRTAVDAMRLGACDYVTKPFPAEELLGATRRALGVRRPARAQTGHGNGRPAVRRLLVLDDPGLGAVLAVTLRGHCGVDTWPGDAAETFAIVHAGPGAVVASGPSQGEALRAALRDSLPACAVLVRPSARRPAGPGRVSPSHHFLRDVIVALQFSPDVSARLLEMPPAVLSVLEYVSAHYAGRMRLPIIAAVSSRSPRYLLRTFQRCMALSVKQFVTRVRVEVALYYLSRTDEKLDALAERVGFADASHLSRVLLRYTGRRPGECRSGRS